jgi:hypothetical protein
MRKGYMRNITTKGLLFLFILFLVSGCSAVRDIKEQLDKNKSPKVITAMDSKSELTVPGGWSVKTDLHEDAQLQVADLISQQYLIVISESKADFAKDLTLKEYTEMIKQNPKETVADAEFSEIKSTLVGGYPANQFEATGSVDKIRIKWLFTIIDAPKNFHQIVAWSTPSRFEKNREIFVNTINSFREVEGDIQLPANVPANQK